MNHPKKEKKRRVEQQIAFSRDTHVFRNLPNMESFYFLLVEQEHHMYLSNINGLKKISQGNEISQSELRSLGTQDCNGAVD